MYTSGYRSYAIEYGTADADQARGFTAEIGMRQGWVMRFITL